MLATDLLRRITVDINTETFERELRKLQYLASAALKGSSSRLAIQGIREIDIKSLSPALNPKEYWSWQNNPGLETLHYEAILKKCLYKALSSLTTVRTIRCVLMAPRRKFHWRYIDDRWLPAQKDSEWAQIAIVNALKTFSHLQNLSVELRYCRIEIPFHLFTALKHVSLHCVGRENSFYYRGKTIENLIKMISESPRLESIDLTNNGGFPSTKSLIRSLHQLFERYPEDVPPLRLKHLSLTSFLVRLDDETVIRHLRYLTSLSLKDILQPLSPYPSGHDNDNPIFKDISETSNRWGSSCEQIWGMILNANLRLEEISVDNIPSTFVEYIGSYSGLKKLIVFVERFQDEVASERVGKKFYEALEMHASSIEELDVRAYFEGVWCFGHHNKTLFSTFKNLKTLSVRLQSSDFIRRSELEHSSRQDIIVSSFQAQSFQWTDTKYIRSIGSPDWHRCEIYASTPRVICVHFQYRTQPS